MKQGLYNLARCVVWGICIALIILFLLSCRAQEITVERTIVRTDTLRLYTKDSVKMKDSVFMAQYLQGDTLYIVKDRWHEKERVHVDTVYKAKVDTIINHEVVEKPVERRLARWEEALMRIGAIATVIPAVVIIGVWWYKRKE